MPGNSGPGQQRKRKAEAQNDKEAPKSPGTWRVPYFGWLVRVTPKPTKGKTKSALAILWEQYPNVLRVDAVHTGVTLTLGEKRNKHAVTKNIRNLLDSVFPEGVFTMEITPTDDATAPLTVAELKYNGLITAFGQHFDQAVRLIQVGPDGRPFYFYGTVLHVNTDHKDVASLLELEGAVQSFAIRYFRLGIKAVNVSLPSLPPSPQQSVDNLGDVQIVLPLPNPGLRIAGGGLFAGAHGKACYVQGQLEPDVLTWLQRDAFLILDGETLEEMELQSFDPPKSTKDWQCRPDVQQDGVQADKMQISGALSVEPASDRMNGLRLPEFKMQRVFLWRQLLFKKNAGSFLSLKSTGNPLVYNGVGNDQNCVMFGPRILFFFCSEGCVRDFLVS